MPSREFWESECFWGLTPWSRGVVKPMYGACQPGHSRNKIEPCSNGQRQQCWPRQSSVHHAPLLALTTSHETFKKSMALKQMAWFRRGWKPTGRESFVLKMQIAFHLMDSFLFRRLMKWIVRPRCLIFSHTLLDAQTENEGWWGWEVGDFPREKEKTSWYH